MAILKELLKGKLSAKELDLLPSSFDIVGNIMVFSDFPSELRKKEKLIGTEILKHFNHISSVFKKTGKYSGKYRTPKLKLIAGENSKETVHRENNSTIRLDVEKVYFSPRSSTERKRVFSLVKSNESVLVMFSGVGAYPITIARNSKAKEIYGIEINPIAHKYASENLKINKISNVKLIKGDVKKILPKINLKFDRILMPLPKEAERYLGLALNKIKKNGIVHFYTFGQETDYEKIKEIVKKECSKQKKKCKIIGIVKCGHYSPGVFRLCVDFKVN